MFVNTIFLPCKHPLGKEEVYAFFVLAERFCKFSPSLCHWKGESSSLPPHPVYTSFVCLCHHFCIWRIQILLSVHLNPQSLQAILCSTFIMVPLLRPFCLCCPSAEEPIHRSPLLLNGLAANNGRLGNKLTITKQSRFTDSSSLQRL